MRCPYCASEVPQAAIVCPHCARDFYLFKPLLERLERLEARMMEQGQAGVEGHERRIAALESELAALKAAQIAGSGAALPETVVEETQPLRRAAPSQFPAADAKSYIASLGLALIPALVLLVAAHIVLLFVYDVRPLYLRIASVLVPIPFGFMLLMRHPQRFHLSTVGGFVMALVAVWLMLVTTAYVDKVPVMPQSVRDAREVLEYMASIGLAFLTGLLLGKLRYRQLYLAAEPSRAIVFLVELVTTDKISELGLVQLANRVQKTASAIAPVGAGVASIYAGVKALIG